MKASLWRAVTESSEWRMWAVEPARQSREELSEKEIRVSMGHRFTLEKKAGRKKTMAIKAFAINSNLSRSFIRGECAPYSRGFKNAGPSLNSSLFHVAKPSCLIPTTPPIRAQRRRKYIHLQNTKTPSCEDSSSSESCLDRDEGKTQPS